MPDWHLQEIRDALESRGWRLVAERPGDEYRVSATWEIERSTKKPSVLIDFAGLDDLIALPLEQSYGCSVRGSDSLGLYFGRKGERGSKRRQSWQRNLQQFLDKLDSFEP
ncbi:MAG TPA: hypothetical protein VFP47_19065 [Pyrinomonadaceae bacterium]|nr:hypothetical protein [Pyrinomonadaceae bacterium]